MFTSVTTQLGSFVTDTFSVVVTCSVLCRIVVVWNYCCRSYVEFCGWGKRHADNRNRSI